MTFSSLFTGSSSLSVFLRFLLYPCRVGFVLPKKFFWENMILEKDTREGTPWQPGRQRWDWKLVMENVSRITMVKVKDFGEKADL